VSQVNSPAPLKLIASNDAAWNERALTSFRERHTRRHGQPRGVRARTVIDCQAARHRIDILNTGALVFVDHLNDHAWRLADWLRLKAGLPISGCASLLFWWRRCEDVGEWRAAQCSARIYIETPPVRAPTATACRYTCSCYVFYDALSSAVARTLTRTTVNARPPDGYVPLVHAYAALRRWRNDPAHVGVYHTSRR